MSATERMTYFIEDAAEGIAELIESEEIKLREAQSEQEASKEKKEELSGRERALIQDESKWEARRRSFTIEAHGEMSDEEFAAKSEDLDKQGARLAKRRKRLESSIRSNGNKYNHGKRDEHRARTTMIAYKAALRLVLLERACRETGEAQLQPDPDEFLMNLRLRPPMI